MTEVLNACFVESTFYLIHCEVSLAESSQYELNTSVVFALRAAEHDDVIRNVSCTRYAVDHLSDCVLKQF